MVALRRESPRLANSWPFPVRMAAMRGCPSTPRCFTRPDGELTAWCPLFFELSIGAAWKRDGAARE